MSDTVRYEVNESVAVITLNRPESLNAMNPEMLATMFQVAERAAADPAVRCVVVTGAGRAFSAGGDVKAMAAGGRDGAEAGAPSDPVARLRQQEEFSRLLQEMPKPTIAAVNGVAAGAGMSVALAADFRVCSDQARFVSAFARVAFSGDFGGSWLLQRLVGQAKAKEIYLLGDPIPAEEALRLGIVTKVVPHEALMDATFALAGRLANGATIALGRMKDNFAYGATHTFAETLQREAENMIFTGTTADHRNAARAFVEKREPTFEGR